MRQIAIAAALSFAVCAAWAAPAAEDKVTEEIIVKGTRPEIEQRVNTFVQGVTHRGYAVESLVRWVEPVCPLVAGIPAEQGEFILRGISQAVRDAGADLAPANCKPNFHVVLTPEPERLLDLWRKRAPKLYGMAPQAQVRRILGKPRPVRVWYNVWDACGDRVKKTGSIVGADTNFGLQMSTPYGGGCLKDSRLLFSSINVISSVIVVVDLDDTKEIKLGPLTDYISMVGLTQVDLDGDWGDEPTILRLFAAGDATSQKLSIWDRAFLKALYDTSQTDRHQRTEIARSMVNDFMGR